jgi:hypothetical protein
LQALSQTTLPWLIPPTSCEQLEEGGKDAPSHFSKPLITPSPQTGLMHPESLSLHSLEQVKFPVLPLPKSLAQVAPSRSSPSHGSEALRFPSPQYSHWLVSIWQLLLQRRLPDAEAPRKFEHLAPPN